MSALRILLVLPLFALHGCAPPAFEWSEGGSPQVSENGPPKTLGQSPSTPEAPKPEEPKPEEPKPEEPKPEEPQPEEPKYPQNAKKPPLGPINDPLQPPLEISFDDLKINMQEDTVFRPWMMTDRAKELDGRKIRLAGYIDGISLDRRKGLKEFILLRNLECKFGAGGRADHLVSVIMNEGKTTDYTNKVIYVEGVLKLKPYRGVDGNTWSIYDLNCEKIKTSRF